MSSNGDVNKSMYARSHGEKWDSNVKNVQWIGYTVVLGQQQ